MQDDSAKWHIISDDDIRWLTETCILPHSVHRSRRCLSSLVRDPDRPGSDPGKELVWRVESVDLSTWPPRKISKIYPDRNI